MISLKVYVSYRKKRLAEMDKLFHELKDNKSALLIIENLRRNNIHIHDDPYYKKLYKRIKAHQENPTIYK